MLGCRIIPTSIQSDWFKTINKKQTNIFSRQFKKIKDETFQFRSLLRVNQAALRAVLKPEIMSSGTQATQIAQIPVRFVYASSTRPFVAVSNNFSRCLDYCFRSFRSLFESSTGAKLFCIWNFLSLAFLASGINLWWLISHHV